MMALRVGSPRASKICAICMRCFGIYFLERGAFTRVTALRRDHQAVGATSIARLPQSSLIPVLGVEIFSEDRLQSARAPSAAKSSRHPAGFRKIQCRHG